MTPSISHLSVFFCLFVFYWAFVLLLFVYLFQISVSHRGKPATFSTYLALFVDTPWIPVQQSQIGWKCGFWLPDFVMTRPVQSASMTMSSSLWTSLPWNTFSFGEKSFSADKDDHCMISWESGTSTFFIRSDNLGTLDFRADREVLWIEVRLWDLYICLYQTFFHYQCTDVKDIRPASAVTLSLLYVYNRPLPWLERLSIPCGPSKSIQRFPVRLDS